MLLITAAAIPIGLVATAVVDTVVNGPAHTLQTARNIIAGVKGLFSAAKRSNIDVEGPKGTLQITLRYSPGLIQLFRSHGQDVLTDFATLERAWKGMHGTAPLTMRLVRTPTIEPITGKRMNGRSNPPEPVDEAHYDEHQALLRDIFLLVTEGDGSGKGVVPRIGWYAEPDEADPGTADPAHP
jgi:hypothetical protein